MHKTALIITTYNRPELLKQCLDSLRSADLSKVSEIVFYDDCSTDAKVSDFICDFMKTHRGIYFTNHKNEGIKNSLLSAYGFAFGFCQCDLAINLDPDAICKPNFINELLRLKSEHPEHIISGFNCNHPQNPVISDHPDHVLRKHCNGINMLIDKQQYEDIIKPALLSSGNWDYSSTHKLPFVISKPSVVQHIGINQSTMGHTGGDVACDFKLLNLPQVCLFGIDAHDPAGIKRAADICTRDVEFGAVTIITERLFSGREAYSEWIIHEMHHHLPPGDYSHVLIIHPDGYIQNPLAWDDEFLNWDYIGARWLYHHHAVGNGGFSLRSRKLIEICSRLEITDTHPEDEKLCKKYRPFLEKEFGIKYATVDVADRFSIEAWNCDKMVDSDGIAGNQYTGQFGFHGYSVKGLPIPPLPRHMPVSSVRNNGRIARRVR